jgi:hypothetical protein
LGEVESLYLGYWVLNIYPFSFRHCPRIIGTFCSDHQSKYLAGIKQEIVNKFNEEGEQVTCKEYDVHTSRSELYNFEDDTLKPLEAGQKRLILCEENLGIDLLDNLNSKSKKQLFSVVHFSPKLLDGHLRWLRWDRPSSDIVILPATVITSQVRKDIEAIGASLLEFEEESFSASVIACQVYEGIITGK